MLRYYLSNFDFETGWNEKVFDLLNRKAKCMNEKEKVCSIMFDAISIKSGLFYNISKDKVDGLEDLATYGKTSHFAKYAMVFMAKGLTTKWKHVLGYFLFHTSIKPEILKQMVLDSISKLQEVNFIPKVVICDQDTCHRSLFAKFHISCLSPTITLNNEQIFFMYDTPHLMKSIRYNFMKYNFSNNDSIAKWDYIKAFYNMDQQMSIRLTPKLTEKHIHCNTFDKMRVKLATQLLSRTVAAAIATYAKLGALPKEAIATAKFVENFDLLFDLFNSGQKFHYKPTKCAFTTSSLSYLTELQTFINSLQVIGTERSLPCVEAWKLNIACLKSFWQNLHDQYDYQFFVD